jgi:hypothetical protein
MLGVEPDALPVPMSDADQEFPRLRRRGIGGWQRPLSQTLALDRANWRVGDTGDRDRDAADGDNDTIHFRAIGRGTGSVRRRARARRNEPAGDKQAS